MFMKTAADWTAPKTEKQALKRLAELGRQVRTVEELDRLLEQDAAMREDPVLRSATKAAIQAVCPHLRAM